MANPSSVAKGLGDAVTRERVLGQLASARAAKKKRGVGVGKALTGATSSELGVSKDNVEWIEENFGVRLYTNQINDVNSLFGKGQAFASVAARGAGKTWGISTGLAAYCIRYPGLRVIVAGPKEKQAGRLIKEIVGLFKSKACKVANEVDKGASSAFHLQFKNGSSIVAVSGQEAANVEGEHGHILVIDEAHKTPSFSITNKLLPMIGMLSFSKLVMIGVAMNKNFFYKFCMAENAMVNKCPWYKAENFQDKKDVIFYKQRPYSQALISRMPLPYKLKYFPDRPDLQKLSGLEVSVTDWETQYELIWLDDLYNFLSDDDQDLLAGGTHSLLTQGLPGEIYVAGLDTAQGSLEGRKDTDETVLSIWRLRKDGLKEKVATFIWVGDPLTQKQEIFDIINPESGLFKCKMTVVDYSNIGIDVVNQFRAMRIPIIGKLFGATEPTSKKNWKNAMYDHFLVELESQKLRYPNIVKLEELKISASGADLIQIKNCLRSFWEWTSLQRIVGRGLNDQIEAPKENIEGEDGESGRGYDDACSADIMGIWAADKLSDLEKEAAKGGDLSTWIIPLGVIGGASSSGVGSMMGATRGQNPFVQQALSQVGAGGAHPGSAPSSGGAASGSWMSDILSSMSSRR